MSAPDEEVLVKIIAPGPTSWSIRLEVVKVNGRLLAWGDPIRPTEDGWEIAYRPPSAEATKP